MRNNREEVRERIRGVLSPAERTKRRLASALPFSCHSGRQGKAEAYKRLEVRSRCGHKAEKEWWL
jgi:hypothetical protein